MLDRSKTDPAIILFAGGFTHVLILTLVVLAAFAQFGIQTVSFVAILAAPSFALGFALQGSLANFAAGVLVLVLRPYKVGDYIDVAGTVKEIELFTTVLATPDNIKIMVPNGKIHADIIKNISAYNTRRVDLAVGIGYTSSMRRAVEVLLDLPSKDAGILSHPEPQIAVSQLAESSVSFVVRPWVRREDYWPVKLDLTREIKEAFDANGIEIPFPQQVVHLMSTQSES